MMMVPDEGMGGGNGGGGSGSGQSPSQDNEPSTYIWRNKLKTPDDFDLYLPKTEGMYKANPDGTLMYDINGKQIPVLDAFNCHYHAFGENKNPSSYDEPFKKMVFDPNLSNFNELSPGDKIQVGDRVLYVGWLDSNTKRITHSAIVTKIDASGYATEVSSKMGESYGIIYHHPRDIPEQYGVTSPSSKFPDGTVRYNRVYYRPK
ncbi:hypothetical protein D3C87_1475210 [compost metagenome]